MALNQEPYPCPLCGKDLRGRGIVFHFRSKHPGEDSKPHLARLFETGVLKRDWDPLRVGKSNVENGANGIVSAPPGEGNASAGSLSEEEEFPPGTFSPARSSSGDAVPAKGDSSPAKKVMAAPGRRFEDSALLVVSPQRFEVNSMILWQAKAITEREWGWPSMTPGDWLDTFIFMLMKKFGIVMGGYIVHEPDGSVRGPRPIHVEEVDDGDSGG